MGEAKQQKKDHWSPGHIKLYQDDSDRQYTSRTLPILHLPLLAMEGMDGATVVPDTA
jgi:hypothetical protein